MHAEASAIIHAVERTCDTSALTYRDVCYWPLVRLRLWSALMQRMVVGKGPESEGVTNTGPTFAATETPPLELVGTPDLGLLRVQSAAPALLRSICSTAGWGRITACTPTSRPHPPAAMIYCPTAFGAGAAARRPISRAP